MVAAAAAFFAQTLAEAIQLRSSNRWGLAEECGSCGDRGCSRKRDSVAHWSFDAESPNCAVGQLAGKHGRIDVQISASVMRLTGHEHDTGGWSFDQRLYC